MKTVAHFPMSLVKDAIKLRKSHSDYGHSFGRKNVAVYCSSPDMSRTHCGSNQLSSISWIKAIGRFNFSRSCYIDCDGNQVWPA